MHVVTTTRSYKGQVYKTHLLRRSYREDGKVCNETLGNLSHLPDHIVDLVRQALKGTSFAPVGELFEVVSSRQHGDVDAVLRTIRRIDLSGLLGVQPCWESRLATGMIVARVVEPQTKLATTRWWNTRTLPEDLHIERADEDALYSAMDWLLLHQDAIEKRLAARHLEEGCTALYDLTSSYFEGTHCSLAKLGHNRDGKANKLQVNYGLLTDSRGCPIAVSVFDGNVNDAKTLLPEVEKLRKTFGLRKVVLVGDRGMIGQTGVEQLRDVEGAGWVTALKSGQIRQLVDQGAIQMGLFDQRNLFELTHPDYPGERLVACRNVDLGRLRAVKRQDLLAATGKELAKVKAMVARGKLKGEGEIGVRVGRVVNKYKVAKHFALDIGPGRFNYSILEDSVASEAGLDGIYVIRTTVGKKEMSAADAVRTYKSLSNVERAFRTLKTIDLKVRPIHHHLADRVRAHIFLCMLAYYVEWHMRQAWAPLLFADEDQEAKAERDPVAPARRSDAAEQKARTHMLEDGTDAHSFRTLLRSLGTIVRNTCRAPGNSESPSTFQVTTTPDKKQRLALDLIEKVAL